MYVEVPLMTKFGCVRAVITSNKHVHLSANNPLELRAGILTAQEEREKFFVYRGKIVNFSLHLYLIDGVWKRKNGEYIYSNDLTLTGKEAVEAACVQAFTEYVTKNPEKLRDAQVSELERELERAEEKLAAAKQEYDEALQRVEKARQELAEIR